MKCKVCGTEMELGKAIKPNIEEGALYVAPPGNITDETLEVIDVWKCPNCGHSEFLDNEWKQLCESKVDEGYYDDLINRLLQENHFMNDIFIQVMRESRGHENPAKVRTRIVHLKDAQI